MKVRQIRDLKYANFVIVVYLLLFLITFGIIFFRLYNLQILDHKNWTKVQTSYTLKSYICKRKIFYDRNFIPLVVNESLKSYIYHIDTPFIKGKIEVKAKSGFFQKETYVINLDNFINSLRNILRKKMPDYYIEGIDKAGKYIKIKNLDKPHEKYLKKLVGDDILRYAKFYPQKARKKIIKKLHSLLRRITSIDYVSRRKYLFGEYTAHICGYINGNGTKTGAEYFLNRVISEETMKSDYPIDLNNTTQKYNVVFTIDLPLQIRTLQFLKEGLLKAQAVKGFAIVMDCNTGEILALANYPSFNPNKYSFYFMQTKIAERFLNLALQNSYEPGSILKVFTIATALEKKIVTPYTTYNCHNGRIYFPKIKKKLKDVHGLGIATVEDILKHSSNIGAALIAMDTGKENIYEFFQKFGFQDKYNIYAISKKDIYLSHSFRGLKPLSEWGAQTITMLPIGQEIQLTGMQIITAFNAVVNGGYLITPHIIKGFLTDKEKFLEVENYEKRKILSTKTSIQMRNMLAKVTQWSPRREDRGTGTKARFRKYPQIKVGGKTGTAQYFDKEICKYHKGKYISSFIGAFPIDNPKYSILITVFFPSYKKRYGGDCAAPIFRKIGEYICEKYLINDYIAYETKTRNIKIK